MVSATKGIEEESLKLMTQVMEDILPSNMASRLLCSPGPALRRKSAADNPPLCVWLVRTRSQSRTLQGLFIAPTFRVYADDDVIGVQLGGSLKNVMALAAGVVDGLELGATLGQR